MSVQREFESAFDAALADILPLAALLESAAEDRSITRERRQRIVELGWPLLSLPEARQGLDLDFEGIARLAIVAGRRLLPAALREEAALLIPALALDSGSDAALSALIAGDEQGGGGGQIPGTGHAALWLSAAATAAAVEHDGMIEVFDVAPLLPALDRRRALEPGQGFALLNLERIRLERPRMTIDGDPARLILRRRRLMLVSEAFGCAEEALALAHRYAVDRVQFGRPIATFQAVAHHLANMKVAVESSRSAIARLVSCLSLDRTEEADDLMAALSFSVPAAAREVVETAIQIHGGMGFTWEYGLHLWYKRVLQLQSVFGGRRGAATAAGRHYLAQRKAAKAATAR